MKTLEFKVNLSLDQETIVFDRSLPDLDWAWNEGLKLILEAHQVKYYDFMMKAAAKRKVEGMETVERVRLTFPKHSAWSLPMMPSSDRMRQHLTDWSQAESTVMIDSEKVPHCAKYKFAGVGGATCRIARITDGVYTPIPASDRLLINEAPMLKFGKNGPETSLGTYLTTARLNAIREQQELPPLKIHSDYLGGLWNQLAAAWQKYVNPKDRQGHKPKFRRNNKRTHKISLYTKQSDGLAIDDQQNKIKLPRLGWLEIVGRRTKRRLKKIDAAFVSSGVLKQEPSGWYVCLTIKNSLENELRESKNAQKSLVKAAKKIDAEISPEVQAHFKTEHDRLETAIAIYARVQSKAKPSRKILGIDPGVNVMYATDDGRLYKPSRAFKLKERKLKRLQRKASRQYEKNKSNSDWQRKNHDRTQRKIALQWEKIRRNRSAYAHKRTTKDLREFAFVGIEDTNLRNITKAAKPQPNETGTGYKKNRRKAKAGLNRSLLNSVIGKLRSLYESKAKIFGRTVVRSAAPRSSQCCYACGGIGDRPKKARSEFYCKNPHCSEFDKLQHADVNAARNHLIGAVLSFTQTEDYRSLVTGRGRTERPKPGESDTARQAKPRRKAEKSSRKGKPQEAVNASDSNPSTEYVEQSRPQGQFSKVHLRESLEVSQSIEQKTPDPLPSNKFRRQKKRSSRAPCPGQLSLTFWDDALGQTG